MNKDVYMLMVQKAARRPECISRKRRSLWSLFGFVICWPLITAILGNASALSASAGIGPGMMPASTSVFSSEIAGADSIIISDIQALLLADSTLGRLSDTLAVVDIESAGHYRIWVKTWYNSGDEQQNESYFLTVIRPDGQIERPTDPNAGPYKVVADLPGPPRTLMRDAGRFYLPRGQNMLIAHHYVTIADSFPQFWHTPVKMPESVFLQSLALVFEPTIDGAVTLRAEPPRKQWNNGDSIGVVFAGEDYFLYLKVTNLQRDSLRQSMLELQYPATVRALETAGSGIVPSDSSGRLRWPPFSLGPYDSLTLAIHFQVADSLPSNVVSIDHLARLFVPGDRNLQNNRAALQLLAQAAGDSGTVPDQQYAEVQVRLHLLSAAPPPADLPRVPAGERIDYRIDVINTGPDSARSIILKAAFPPWLRDWQWSRRPDAVLPDSMLWHLPDLAESDSLSIRLSAVLPTCPENAPVTFTTTATIRAANDRQTENNRASISAVLEAPAYDLAATLSTAADTIVFYQHEPVPAIRARENHFVDVVIRHLSGDAGCDVHTEIDIPAGVTFASLPEPFIQREGQLQADVPSPAAGDSLRFRLNFDVPPIQSDSLLLYFRVRLQSRFDTNAVNDTSTLALLVLPPPAVPRHALDLAVTLEAASDSTVLFNNRPTPAVHPGEAFNVHLQVHNFGPGSADTVSLFLAMPAPLRLLHASEALVSTAPSRSIYRWTLPNLAADSVLNVPLRAMLPPNSDPPPHPMTLFGWIESSQDTLPDNNRDSTAVVPLSAPIYWPDLSLTLWLQSDSFTVVRGDTLWLGRPGGEYNAELYVQNIGQSPALDIQLALRWSEGLELLAAEPSPMATAPDSAIWNLPPLLPDDAVVLQVRFRLPDELPLGVHVFEHRAQVSAENEPDNLLTNNAARDSIIVAVQHTLPPPGIEAEPPVVSVGDSVVLRVQVPEPVVEWDLWVYYANGEIDSTYADAFFETTRPVPQTWYQVEPLFRDTRLTTEAKEEQIVFELRIQDELGFRNSARAGVRIRSANAFTLDRNVFNPTREDRMALRFKLSSRRTARLDLYDLSGQHITRIAEGVFEPDWNTYFWDGRTETGQEVGSGVYIVLLRSGEFESWKKVIIVR